MWLALANVISEGMMWLIIIEEEFLSDWAYPAVPMGRMKDVELV